MDAEKQLSEQESLKLITEMIQKAKGGFHEKGTSAILWGSVVSFAGFFNFAELYWHFDIGFDIWLIVLAAFIPQIIISIREGKDKKVVSHDEAFLNSVWLIYAITIFALIFYLNVVPGVTEGMFLKEGTELLMKDATGKVEPFKPFVLSSASLFLIIYAIPTLATGVARKHKPMLFGGILCYILFVVSCFTPRVWDILLLGFAGVFNWLIPGLVMRSSYLKARKRNV